MTFLVGVLLLGCRSSPPSVAVLPLANVSADPEDSDYLAQGISRAVITKLTQAGLRVTPWDTARRYSESAKRVEDIARELGVDSVLVGTFELAGDRMLTTLSLVDARTGLQSWADEFAGPFEDVLEVQRRIALGAARSLKQELTGEEETTLSAPESQSAEAYDQYLQGVHLFQQGTEEATEIAFQYFNRALTLDPNLSDAHMGLGTVHYTRYVYGWGGVDSLDAAGRSYARALELDPENLRARRGSIFLHYFRGKPEEVLAQGELAARYARASDPELLLTRLTAYGFGGLPERLPPLVRKLRELEGVDAEVLYALVLHTWASIPGETIAAGNRYFDQFGDDPDLREFVAFAHIRLGELDRARWNYERAVELIVRDEGFPEPALFAGFFYDHVGENARAQELWKTGLALIEPRVASHPDNLRLRVFEACFRGLIGDVPFLLSATEEILSSRANAFDLQFLAIVLARSGLEKRAVDVLLTSVRRGLPDPLWESYFIAAFEPRDDPGFETVMKETEAALVRLRETY